MGGAKGKGGKNRKKGTNKTEVAKRDLITREDGQEYGICTAMLGCNKIKVHLFSGSDVIGVIRGKIVRRMWINLGNVVLCGNREFQSGAQKVDIILRYTWDEVSDLQRLNEIPDISRWSLVGRGGVEESEDPTSGNVKFTSETNGSNAIKPKANEGWEMPSESDDDDHTRHHITNNGKNDGKDNDDSDNSGEDGEESGDSDDDDDDDSSDDEDEAAAKKEAELLMFNTYKKEDYHTKKVSKKTDRRANASEKQSGGGGGGGAPAGANTKGGNVKVESYRGGHAIPAQRVVKSLSDNEDDFNIDDI